MEGRRFVRYNPMLPTTQEAKDNYDQVTSDHVPITTTLCFGESQMFTVVSWNVLEFDGANGFAGTDGEGKVYGETEEQKNRRHKRIEKVLKKFDDKQLLDVILLQEIDQDGDLLRSILKKLGSGWTAVRRTTEYRDNADGSVITLINADKVKSAEYKKISGNNIGSNSAIITMNSGAKVHLLNVHSPFSVVPYKHEEEVKKFLKEQADKDADLTVVAGDFNTQIAPLHEKPRAITTSAAPPMFRGGKFQGAAAVDGVFFATGKERKVQQAKVKMLNPETGEHFTRHELWPLRTATLPDLQREEIEAVKMVMCLDEDYLAQKLVAGKYTLQKYENLLNKNYGTPNKTPRIRVRMARDLNNNPFIAIGCNELLRNKEANLAEFFSLIEEGASTYTWTEEDGVQHRMVCFPKNDLKLGESNLPIISRVNDVSDNEDKSSITPFRLRIAGGVGVLTGASVSTAILFYLALTVGAALPLPILGAVVAGGVVVALLTIAVVMAGFMAYDYFKDKPEVEARVEENLMVEESESDESPSPRNNPTEMTRALTAPSAGVQEKVKKSDESSSAPPVSDAPSPTPVVKEGENALADVSLEPVAKLSAVTLQQFNYFKQQEINPVIVVREGNVLLKNGKEAAKEKVDAIYEKLSSKEKVSGFDFFISVCANEKNNLLFINKTLSAQRNIFAKLRASDGGVDDAYPLIKSDHTIDEETLQIIRCAVKTAGMKIEIVSPISDFSSVVAKI